MYILFVVDVCMFGYSADCSTTVSKHMIICSLYYDHVLGYVKLFGIALFVA